MNKKIQIADFIIHFLYQKGVKYIFGYSGGAITPLIDAINRFKKMKFIQVYHEQTASIAAEGYTWNSNSIGVAIATSGPGATNLITGIADAYFDSIPALYITGQVNTYEYKGQKPIRQQGFQETDIISIVKSITKYAKLITSADAIYDELNKSISIALTHRQGPVLLDIPMNVQKEVIEVDINDNNVSNRENENSIVFLNNTNEELALNKINNAQRPIIIAGNGVISSKAEAELNEFANKSKIPVVTSLLGKGAFNESNVLSLGMIGSYGNRCANMAVANSDMVLALGTRLDTRQTGTQINSFAREADIIRIDIDENEIIHHRLNKVLGIKSDIKCFLKHVINKVHYENNSDWISYINKLKTRFNQDEEVKRNIDNKLPYKIMEILNKYSNDDTLYTVDVGQNQMFAAQSIVIRKNQKFKTSGGLAPMGYAVPFAIGACFANDCKGNYIAIVGDGGLHISLQSLLLLSQYKMPIKIILINNHSLGMITQFQDLYYDKRIEGTTKKSGYYTPDFKSISKAYFIDYYSIDKNNIDDRSIYKTVFSSDMPALIEFDVGEKTVVYPKLEFNKPIEEISPLLSEKEFNKYMLIKRKKNK